MIIFPIIFLTFIVICVTIGLWSNVQDDIETETKEIIKINKGFKDIHNVIDMRI